MLGARIRREQTAHTNWCARNHTCGVVEHRSPNIIADEIGGRAVLTRVRAGGVEYVEARIRIPLHSTDAGARWQLSTALRHMRELLRAVAVRPGVVGSAPRLSAPTQKGVSK